MIVVHVSINVKKEYLESFLAATIENAENSLKEPGISRFNVLQSRDDESKFILNEVYQDENAVIAHKNTDHYAKWRSTVENMMAEPRFSIKYINLFPLDKDF